MKTILSPSILSANFLHLGQEVEAVLQGGAQWIHVDVMDGHFVPNLSIGVPILQALRQRWPELYLDVHLMISHPHRFFEPFLRAGASLLTFHWEACPHPKALCEVLREKEVHVGVALKPKTSPEVLTEVLPLVDLILVMTVEPGFSGQDFLPAMVEKIRTLRKMGYQGHIQVDGGIRAETARLCLEEGANVFVAASAIFKHPEGPQKGAEELKRAIT